MRLASKSLSYASPEKGIVAYEFSYYTRPAGPEKMRIRFLELRDDIYDCGQRSFSTDNGLTWSAAVPFTMSQKTSQGTLRRMEAPGNVDPHNGYLLTPMLEGVLSHDEPLDAMKACYLVYRVSADGGRSALVEDRIIQKGNYTSEHPLEHVWVGKNAIMTGAVNSILGSTNSRLIVAAQLMPIGPDGEYYNPGGGYTWSEVLIVFGRWLSGGHIEWECGPRIAIDPALSTRGAIEPTLARMPDGRILMVMRGSNGGSRDPQHKLPGYKWYSVSKDDGLSWTTPTPWRYSDGAPFFSPSGISQLLTHSSGRYYWIGNICPVNPQGNLPRYPVVIGEVDPKTLGLFKKSMFVIDTRRPEDPEQLYLSNFIAHEDRVSGEIVMHMTRMYTDENGLPGGHSYVYRLVP